MQFTKHIQDNIPKEVSLRLQSFFTQAAQLSSNNEEEAFLLGLIIKKAREENRIDEYTDNLIRKAAEQHSAFTFYTLKKQTTFS